MTRVNACLICGAEDGVAASLVEWKEPIGGRRFESLPRCRDRAACRERVALLGEPWPLADSRPLAAEIQR